MLMDEPEQSRHQGFIERYRHTGQAHIIGRGREVSARRKDGSCFPIWLAVSEVMLGEQRIFTGFLRDITELKAVEKMKDEFVATVSHELRTPLTAIHVSLGLLWEGTAPPEKREELVQIARSNTGRLIRLVNDILDLQKIEAGRFELSPRELEAAEVVDAALSGVAALAEQGEVRLRREGGARLSADRDRLLQVLTNLVANALKFAPPGSEVAVAIQAVGDGVRFEVRDEGPGIEAEELPRLFGKFQQLSAGAGGGRVGSGLGLAISKALIEQHGGRIGVESRAGEGSTFWFELPRLPKAGRRPFLPEVGGP
jgi:signal transduction histidine kinase